MDYIFGGDDEEEDDDYWGGFETDYAQDSSNEVQVDSKDKSSEAEGKENDLLYSKRKSKGNKRRKQRKGSNSKKISHRGHKRVKPELPCLPEKQSICLNVNTSLISSSNPLNCDLKYDFCVDDCDCPGFQKCCINSCGRKECLPSFVQSPTTAPEPVANESAGSSNPAQIPDPSRKSESVTEKAVDAVAEEAITAPVPVLAARIK